MGKIVTILYLVSSIVCIYSFFSSAHDVFKKKKSIHEKLISDTQMFAATVAVLVCLFHQYSYVTTHIPEGKYIIDVSLMIDNSDIALSLPGELIVSENEEYEEDSWYAGGAEFNTTRIYKNTDFYLYGVYFGEINSEKFYRIETNVYPETEIDVDLDYNSAVVNIGYISPERLGITWEENFKNEGIFGLSEFLLITCSGILLVSQYFLLDRSRKK